MLTLTKTATPVAAYLVREGDEMACDYPYEKFGPIFSRKERITMFIAGCQNCGKSYYISQFIRLYKTLRPERDQSTL